MRTIAVVEKNKISFDDIEKFASPLLYCEHTMEGRHQIKKDLHDYLWSLVKPYITFIDLDDTDDFLTVVCFQAIKCFPGRNPDDFLYHTEGSYSFPKKMMEVIYSQPTWKEYQNNQVENMNDIGCLFSLKHHIMENNCVIFADRYDLQAPRFVEIDAITREDILRVIRRRFFHSAVVIKEQTMTKYYYQDPRFLVAKVFGLGNEDTIETMSFTQLGYNLLYYFKQNKTAYVNQIATRINGLHRVHGDVIVLHEMEEKIFANLSVHEMKRLNVLSYGRLYDRQLKEYDSHQVITTEVDDTGKEIEKKVTPLWSRYVIAEHRMITWRQKKSKCINCDRDMLHPIICHRCYRVKYCSNQCEEEFQSYHADECIKLC